MPDGWYLSHDRPANPNPGGGGYSGILQEFHVPWPACNQDAARQAADAFTALADGIDDVTADCNSAVASIRLNNAGQAIDAFAAKWQQYGGKAGTLPVCSAACRALATACNDLANQVSGVKTEIEHKAEELVAAVVGAAVALIFTWGASVAVAEATGEMVASWVTALMGTLADEAAGISIALSDAVGAVGAAAVPIAGAAAEGVTANAIRGTFAAMFSEEFDTSLNAINGEPQPSVEELGLDVASDAGKSALLGVLAEAVPSLANGVVTQPSAVVMQAYGQAVDFSPQLAGVIMSSARVAQLLDTPAGKAFVAGGGIAALNAKGILDESETTAKSVETSLEAMLNQMTATGGGE